MGTWLQIQTAISGNMAVCKFKDEYHKILFCFNEPRTFVAHSFHYKIDTLQQKFVGQLDRRNGNTFEAEGILASVTVKVHVQVANGAHTVIAANRILHCAGAIINSMNEQVIVKEGQRPEYGRFIDRFQFGFQISQAESLFKVRHSSKD